MAVADRGMAVALRALTSLAGSDVLDRLGLRDRAERALNGATKGGFRAAGAAARTFSTVQRNGRPARQKPGVRSDLFDLTPDDEQAMMREAVGDFAMTRFRKAALDADAACEPPADLMSQANELGISMLGVPEEMGGALSERSAVTSALVSEALGRGDMGLAVAALSPAAVATAIGLWGDSGQQGTYLPALVGDDVPVAALAIQEPRALFDPLELRTTATRTDGGFKLDGEKSVVARGVGLRALRDRSRS